MARSIVVRWQGEESAFGFVKVEREKLYGRKQRVVVDEQGRSCSGAWLTGDGTALVPLGGTAHVWIDETWQASEQEERAAVDTEGTALEVRPSTLGVPQDAREADAMRVLDHVVSAVYQLAPETVTPEMESLLAAGRIVEIPFRYRDGYDQDVMFVLRNEDGMFALVCRDAGFRMLEREQITDALEPGDESDELEGDLDFSMM